MKARSAPASLVCLLAVLGCARGDRPAATAPAGAVIPIHERIPGSKLVILPRSGHMTFVDQPQAFLRAVDEFLGAAGR